MRAGIICEYNPMHVGHYYHINETRGRGAEHIICCMSGNYVQRGEPAAIDKWSRCEAALKSGADLVVEIPTPWCLDSAKNYARAGVQILDALNCNYVSCGAENPNQKLALSILSYSRSPKTSELVRGYMSMGNPYPLAFSLAMEAQLGKEASDFLAKPNNTLMLEYISAIREMNSVMSLLPVQRIGSDYNSTGLGTMYPSATAIRSRENMLDMSPYLAPGMAYEMSMAFKKNSAPAKLERAALPILTKLAGMSRMEMTMYTGDDDLSGRIISSLDGAKSYAELMENCANKSVTTAKLKRAIMRCFLGIPATMSSGFVPYIKVLGIGKKGEGLLKGSKLPVIAGVSDVKKLSDSAKLIYETECKATNLYGTFTPEFLYYAAEQRSKVIKQLNLF